MKKLKKILFEYQSFRIVQRCFLSVFFLMFIISIVPVSGQTVGTLRITTAVADGALPSGVTVSGGNPKVITFNGTGNVDLNPATILTSLNGGSSVQIETSGADRSITFDASITKNSGGDATLTIRASRRVSFEENRTIESTSGKLNVVLWSDSDASGDASGCSMLGTIRSNGGHFWMGGANTNAGYASWNGLTIGDGPSRGSTGNNYGSADLVGLIDSRVTYPSSNGSGGDILIWAANSVWNGIAIKKTSSNVEPQIMAGNGDVTIIAKYFNNWNNSGATLEISTTGVLTFASPSETSAKWGDFNWQTTTSGADFTLSFINGHSNAGEARPVKIKNLSTLGGLVIGRYSDMLTSGSPATNLFPYVYDAGVAINSPTTIAGPISLSGGTLTVTSNLTSSNGGNISLYSNSLILAGVLSSTGNLSIAGQATSTTIGIAGVPSTLSIPSSYFATNFSSSLNSITIGSDAHTGAITAGTFTLTAPTAFKSTALTIAGPITLGNRDLTIDSRIAAVGGITSTTYFRTNGVGKLKRTIPVNGSFQFPVGVTLTASGMTVPVYLPITITNKDVQSEYYVSVSNGVYTDGATAGTTTGTLVTNPAPRIDMTWNIGNSVGSVSGTGIDLVVNWPVAASAIFAGTSSLTTPTLLHHNGTQWGTIAGTTTYTLETGTLTHTGYVGTFSPFAIAQSSGALPVTWLSFTATKNAEAVDLLWTTSSELNTKDFEVQHSVNTQDWAVLATVAAAGNSATARTYRYTHSNPLKGNTVYNYYRIKQRDLDGQYSFSKIVSLLFGRPGADIQVYPNPVQDRLIVFAAEPQMARLVNLSGAVVWQGFLVAGRNELLLSSVASGSYVLITKHGARKVLFN